MSDTRTYRQRLIDQGWHAGERENVEIRVVPYDLSWLLVVGPCASFGYWWCIKRVRRGHSYAGERGEQNILRAATAALVKVEEIAREFSREFEAEMTI